MPNVPPLSAVRAFEAAARHQSFTHAAEELGMTQAAVSYQIKLLEDRIGAPLFVRRPRQVVLTPMGERLAAPVTQALNTLAAAFADARERNDTLLSITTLQTFANTWLAPRLAAFQAEHPDLDVRLDASERVVDLAADAFDVALRSGTGDWPGLAAHKLFPVTYTPACSPDFAAKMNFKTPKDLLKARLLGANDPWWRKWFDEVGVAFGESEAAPTIALGTQAMEAQAAMLGHGVAIVTPFFYAAEFAAGRLVQLFDHIADDGRHYWLVYPHALKKARKITLFRDWITREIAAAVSLRDKCVSASVTPRVTIKRQA